MLAGTKHGKTLYKTKTHISYWLTLVEKREKCATQRSQLTHDQLETDNSDVARTCARATASIPNCPCKKNFQSQAMMMMVRKSDNLKTYKA